MVFRVYRRRKCCPKIISFPVNNRSEPERS
jgi:hypothetical protein